MIKVQAKKQYIDNHLITRRIKFKKVLKIKNFEFLNYTKTNIQKFLHFQKPN